jgi:hypothetical protein
MKKILFSILITCVVAVAGHGQQTSRDAAELSRMLNEFLIGAGRNDAAVHDKFWADDLIYTRAAGQRIGKPELMRGVRSAPPSTAGTAKSVYTAEDVRIQLYGEAAIVAFRLVGTTEKDGQTETSRFLNTGTFIKRNGKWQAVAWQATAIPKIPQP